jgi:hypothetical protein
MDCALSRLADFSRRPGSLLFALLGGSIGSVIGLTFTRPELFTSLLDSDTIPANVMRKLALSLLFTVSVGMRADAITILSVQTGNNSAVALGGSGFLGESWSSSNTYANVTISATVSRAPCCPTDPIVYVTAYLTSEIGPGTTLADQIATATVAVPGFGFTFTTLFSDLTLGPGNYFLTLAATDPTNGGTVAWGYTTTPADAEVVADTGVARLGDYRTSGIPDLAYPPASGFIGDPSWNGLQVTGDAVSQVPEPSTFLLFALGLPVSLRLIRGK